MATDPAPSRDAGDALVRMTGPMLAALDEARRVTGLDRTNYIRQAIWRALVQDGFAGKLPATALARARDALELVQYNLGPLAAEPCDSPIMEPADPVDPTIPHDDCGECASCRARAALATIEIDLLEGALGIKL